MLLGITRRTVYLLLTALVLTSEAKHDWGPLGNFLADMLDLDRVGNPDAAARVREEKRKRAVERSSFRAGVERLKNDDLLLGSGSFASLNLGV